MPRFFVSEDQFSDDTVILTGEDAHHIARSLRMAAGEHITVCDPSGLEFDCELISFEQDKRVVAKVLSSKPSQNEPPYGAYLFQALPKGEKFDSIIQKAVELGAAGIVPVEMKRCVVKLEEKKKKSRRERWQAIAESAAKQSKRSRIPEVGEVLSYQAAMTMAGEMDLFLLPYENERGMAATREALETIRPGMKVAILIGPEGGFDPKEVDKAVEKGARSISLGRRILRTETAAITAVGMCMLHIETNLGGEDA